jgi:hypothetical protein
MKSPKINIDLSKIVEDAESIDREPDSQTLLEEKDLDWHEKQISLYEILCKIREREKYANRIFNMVACWLLGIGSLILLDGFFSPYNWFHLSDAIVIAAIGGTTINIVGVFVIVAKHLFPVEGRSVGRLAKYTNKKGK